MKMYWACSFAKVPFKPTVNYNESPYKEQLAAFVKSNPEKMEKIANETYENIKNQYISNFDKELIDYKNGIIGDSHIFNLGKPSEILQKSGFPPHNRIELASARLKLKSQQTNHPFDIEDIIGLDKALKSPIAVFEYGDKNKSQNVIVNLEKDGKNFLVGVFFNQKRDGFEVSSIRGLFNRDNIDWIRWIEQGKMIYGNKEKIQVSIAQQRTNLADVNNQDVRTSSDTYYLDSTTSILLKFGDVNVVCFLIKNKEDMKYLILEVCLIVIILIGFVGLNREN